MTEVAGNIHAKFETGLRCVQELETHPKSPERQTAIQQTREELRVLEKLVRSPREEFYRIFARLQGAAERAHQAGCRANSFAGGGSHAAKANARPDLA